MEDSEDISDDGKTLWSSLLQEVKEKSSKSRNTPCGILVMGEENSGKSCLISRLQKSDPKNGAGLEFEFIDVKDESMDENKQLNVWIASGDTFHSNLLKYALDENNFEYTLCIITVSLAEPWAIMESLEQWLEILQKHIDRLKLDPRNQTNLKESLSRHFQEYTEPEVDLIAPVVIGKRRDADFNYLHPIAVDDPDRILLPLGEKVFERNLGLPIIVVITKTDQVSTLEQDFQYDDDKFDFIQMNIRQLCLKYGAALFYTSLKDGRNCELLMRYILHRCYGFPFIDTASVIEKDAVFIPAGWDNTNKINILAENLPEDIRDQHFDNFISKPLSLLRALAQNRMSEPEMAEDEQVFLMKQQAQIQRIKAMANADPNAKPDSARGPLTKGSTLAPTSSNRSRKNLPGQASVGVNPSNPGAQGNEGVLANFFSSLLNKRAGAGGPPLLNQQSTTSDPGKLTENSSEAEDSLREDLKVEEVVMPAIINVEENSSPSHHFIKIDETLQELDDEYSNEAKEELYEFQENKLMEEENEEESFSSDQKIISDNVENIEELSTIKEMKNNENSENKEEDKVENTLANTLEDVSKFVKDVSEDESQSKRMLENIVNEETDETCNNNDYIVEKNEKENIEESENIERSEDNNDLNKYKCTPSAETVDNLEDDSNNKRICDDKSNDDEVYENKSNDIEGNDKINYDNEESLDKNIVNEGGEYNDIKENIKDSEGNSDNSNNVEDSEDKIKDNGENDIKESKEKSNNDENNNKDDEDEGTIDKCIDNEGSENKMSDNKRNDDENNNNNEEKREDKNEGSRDKSSERNDDQSNYKDKEEREDNVDDNDGSMDKSNENEQSEIDNNENEFFCKDNEGSEDKNSDNENKSNDKEKLDDKKIDNAGSESNDIKEEINNNEDNLDTNNNDNDSKDKINDNVSDADKINEFEESEFKIHENDENKSINDNKDDNKDKDDEVDNAEGNNIKGEDAVIDIEQKIIDKSEEVGQNNESGTGDDSKNIIHEGGHV